MNTQADRARTFRALHKPGDPLVLVNVWDAVSARIVEKAGAKALASSSAAIAWSRGYADGEQISREEMLEGVKIVVQAAHVPLTADLECGYGAAIEDAVATARGAIDAGAVGLNFEDWNGAELVDAEAQAERIAAMLAAGEEKGIALSINARTDVYLENVGENAAWRFAETVRRSNRYLQAGAACAFVPGLDDEETIAKLVKAIDGPVSVLAREGSPSVARLASIGVARVSVGAAAMAHALHAFRDAAQAIGSRGEFTSLAPRMTHGELDGLFG